MEHANVSNATKTRAVHLVGIKAYFAIANAVQEYVYAVYSAYACVCSVPADITSIPSVPYSGIINTVQL